MKSISLTFALISTLLVAQTLQAPNFIFAEFNNYLQKSLKPLNFDSCHHVRKIIGKVPKAIAFINKSEASMKTLMTGFPHYSQLVAGLLSSNGLKYSTSSFGASSGMQTYRKTIIFGHKDKGSNPPTYSLVKLDLLLTALVTDHGNDSHRCMEHMATKSLMKKFQSITPKAVFLGQKDLSSDTTNEVELF